ncbi:hypothetical protein SAMN02745130_03012 [Thiothrix eikelboomii]|uniref:Uncharacterized protein n=1 Tax=Thiothrix eikelboomii TaxID=92487 RepID=A0A1T4XJB8_9GAMM|nr:hypothetical protein [Thiothrix eikelboomii]SKA89181.1 hypothetical protein SAMN02745130_03012 [Thiothrix eikelboomii]
MGNQVGAYLAHGVAQGVVSVLQGGKFGSGFFGHLAGGIQAFGAPSTGGFGAMVGRTMVAAVVGGTVSQITGGKFANGALTATERGVIHIHLLQGDADFFRDRLSKFQRR